MVVPMLNKFTKRIFLCALITLSLLLGGSILDRSPEDKQLGTKIDKGKEVFGELAEKITYIELNKGLDETSNKGPNDELYGEASGGVSQVTLDFLDAEVPEGQRVWYSEDGKLLGFESKTSSPGKIMVLISPTNKIDASITGAADQKNIVLSLSPFASSLLDIKFINQHTVGIEGHINPSTNVYQLFDLNTGEVLQQFYGCGFVHYGDIIYYVQAPPHFGGIKGYNRILTSKGELLYESAENVIIDSDLEIKGDSLSFTERENGTDNPVLKTIKIGEVLHHEGSVSYYEQVEYR